MKNKPLIFFLNKGSRVKFLNKGLGVNFMRGAEERISSCIAASLVRISCDAKRGMKERDGERH